MALRWLVVKDLQILRRSRLLVGLLVIYPVVIALLIGFALSRGPGKPRIAILNEVPPGQGAIEIGSSRLSIGRYAHDLFQSIDPIFVHTRAQALAEVRSGRALGAIVIPPDITQKLSSGVEQPTIQVIYNVADPVKARFVRSTIEARVADANQALSSKLTQTAGDYIRLLLTGGSFSLLGRHFDILGLERARAILRAAQAKLPRGSPERVSVTRVIGFATLAIDNLNLSNNVLRSVGSPLRVRPVNLQGQRTPLDAFAVAIAVTVSLMFLTVLLAAGLLALEREERAFSRLVRGLVSRLGLLTEKIGLAAGCAFAVTLLMLMGLGLFVSLRWGRFPLWVAALAFGGLAFAAMGVAIGGLAREVRAASLLALLLSLPIAFLALVPSGSVSGGLYGVVSVASAAFPFKPTLQALDNALNGASPALWVSLAHLIGLTLAFGLIARLALRRFAD